MKSRRERFSLVPHLTPEQQAEREFNMIASTFPARPLNEHLIGEMYKKLVKMELLIEAMQAKPQRIDDKLVDAKYIAQRFGCSHNSASTLIDKIGAVRVGPNGGLKRCRLSDVDRYQASPHDYEIEHAA